VAGTHDPRRPVDVEPRIALGRSDRLARVDAHPDPDRAVPQRLLSRRRGGERLFRAREAVEEGVALRVDLDTAMALEGFPQHTAVLGEDVGVAVAELVEQLRRAFDVGEEECDGPGRELAHR
jgi:hypothetical protein